MSKCASHRPPARRHRKTNDRHPMDFLKTNYDRVLLIVAGFMLVGITAYMAMGMSGIRAEFPLPSVASKGAPFEADVELARLASEAPRLREPEKSGWGEADQALFVSRVYLLREGQLVDILESDTELVPGISNAWILKYKLDYTDSNLGQTDPDSDAFTNSEEFRAGTDPTDPKSKPAPWTKLRLASSKIEKLRTKFESLPRGDLDVVQINTVSAEDPSALTGVSKFYKRNDPILLSETVNGRQVESATPLSFKGARMVRRFNEKTNSDQEIPTITLLSSVDGIEIELVQGEVKDSPYSLATLQDTRTGGQSYTLRSGQEFELEPGQGYKLIDVSEEAATIKDLASGEQLSIPRLETDALIAPPSSE